MADFAFRGEGGKVKIIHHSHSYGDYPENHPEFGGDRWTIPKGKLIGKANSHEEATSLVRKHAGGPVNHDTSEYIGDVYYKEEHPHSGGDFYRITK